jgi:hypothetical protein
VTKKLLAAQIMLSSQSPTTRPTRNRRAVNDSSNLMLGHIALFNTITTCWQTEIRRRGSLSFIGVRHSSLSTSFAGENPLSDDGADLWCQMPSTRPSRRI